jgi:replicative DNA helicase
MLAAVERQPPHNIEAEQSVLGSLIIDPDAYIRVAEYLKSDDFYRETHTVLYRAIEGLNERRLPSDFVTLCDELSRLDVLDNVGGASYVTSLVNSVPTSTHVEYYGKIVERTATLRRLIAAGGQIAQLGYMETDDIERTLDEAEQIIFRVSQRRVNSDFVPLKALIADYLDKIDYLHENRGQVAGVPTGFIDLDKLTGGLQPSDLIVIAARPSVGKSALTLSIAHATALKFKTCVGIFTLEMSAEQLVQRFVAIETGIDQQRLRTGNIEEREWDSIVRASNTLSEAQIFIDDTVGISTLEMRAKARRLAAQYPLGLIIVDYLQLMQSRRNVDNRVAEISEISRSLKGLARELNIPVVALSQLSRAVEARTSHEPQLSDLRESGSIEQDSDIVMFIYRDEVYNQASERKGIADIIVAKHRNGPIGKISLRFVQQLAHFTDLDLYHPPDDH